jgi:ubiquinone/menaquinone biosynthesis C-methylase UbiE
LQPINYDDVAPEYDRRYDRYRYEGVRAVLHGFARSTSDASIGEIGCGTGHWLADLRNAGCRRLAGLDRSERMLAYACAAVPDAWLTRGTAEHLCWIDACFDRVFCVNALHHFSDPRAFVSECRRVLRPGGRLLTVGLDPHAGTDRWWVYDFFPGTLERDLLRFPSAATIRTWLAAAGFRDSVTKLAEHINAAIPFEAASQQLLFDRRATSQLMAITDDEFEAGMERLRAERPVLRSNVRLYGTTACR